MHQELGQREAHDRVVRCQRLQATEGRQGVGGAPEALVGLDESEEGAFEVRLEGRGDLIGDVQDERRRDPIPIRGVTELVGCSDGGLEVGRRFLERAGLEGEAAGHERAIGEVGRRAQVDKGRDVVAVDQRSTSVDERLLIGRSHQPTKEGQRQLLAGRAALYWGGRAPDPAGESHSGGFGARLQEAPSPGRPPRPSPAPPPYRNAPHPHLPRTSLDGEPGAPPQRRPRAC